MPRGLSDREKRRWSALVGTLGSLGLAHEADAAVIESMVVMWARAQAADAVVRREGLFSEGSKGQMAAHPAVKISQESWAAVRGLADQLGASPLARERLPATPYDEDEDWRFGLDGAWPAPVPLHGGDAG